MSDLSYTQRPSKTTSHINQAFFNVNQLKVNAHDHQARNWKNNGKIKYKICGVDDHKLLRQLVDSRPEQTTFRILDVGAGDFIWSESMAEMFSENYPKKTLVAYGVVGERCDEKEYKIHNNTVKNFCSFKVEEIEKEFLVKESIDLSNQIDLIVASNVMIHLIDPLGTFIQLTNLLKTDGLILSDSFAFNLVNQNNQELYPAFTEEKENNVGLRMYNILSQTQGKYLVCPDTRFIDDMQTREKVYSPEFMLQKTNELSFPYHYSGEISDYISKLIGTDCAAEQKNVKTLTITNQGRIPFIIARYCNVIKTNQEQEFTVNYKSCGNMQELKDKYIGNEELFNFIPIDTLLGEADIYGEYQSSDMYCKELTQV